MFLVSLLALTAVSAAENTTEDIAIADDGICEELDVSTDEILTSTPTIADLNRTINNNTDSEITLDSDYTYTSSDSNFTHGIEIKRTLTINGNGHTINGGDTIRIFHCIEGHIIFKNLTFINGYTHLDGYGGAIWADKDTAYVETINCTFSNNHAHYGGAIAHVHAVNCTFNSNTAEWEGGAAYDVNAENCTFYSNSASNGGAIFIPETTNLDKFITNCIFIKNFANGLEGGGAIYSSQSTFWMINHCIFVNNIAKSDVGGTGKGGAINFDRVQNNYIFNCIFVNNTEDANGTIYLHYCQRCVISGSVITSNSDTSIYSDMYDLTADENWFGNNATDYNVKPNVGDNIKMTKWLFLKGTANPNTVGITHTADITFDLYCYDSATGETSKYDIGRLLPIMIINSTNGNIDKDIAETGEVIKYTATSLGTDTITAKFANITSTIEITVRKASFSDLQNLINNAEEGSTITLQANYTYTDADYDLRHGITINRNLTIDGNGYTINGAKKARIFHVTGGNIIFKNIILADGSTDTNGNGGAIWVENNANGTAINCTFTNNVATNGGAISNGNAMNCTFNSNIATSGGAISKGKAVNCIFNANNAQRGGAIKDGSAINSTFNSNSAGYGGAIDKGDAVNCTFNKNEATNGGAIYEGSAFNCIFNSNHGGNGGALYGGTAINSTFTSNNATNGGAIYHEFNGEIYNCTFINNSANYGGAISKIGDGTKLYNCNFVNNSADYGSALHWAGHDDEIYNCTFINNKAEKDTGAIELHEGSNAIVFNCIFTNNNAKQGSAIKLIGYTNANVFSCIFANNNASNGTIYNKDSNGIRITRNIFLNNTGPDIYFVGDCTNSNVNYNWFGNTADNYETAPNTQNVIIDTWLFLNATANPKAMKTLDSSDIVFKLYAYNSTSKAISEYDNTLLSPVNLTITANDGDLNATIANLGETIRFTAKGTDTYVTATIENTTYTIKLDVTKLDSDLSVKSKQVPYTGNTNITLSYNANATGKVNITLKGKKYNLTFTNIDLNATITLGNILPDEYDVTVAYSGDKCFYNKTAKATLNITKANPNLTVESKEVPYTGNTNITLSYNSLATGKVNITLKGKKYNLTFTDIDLNTQITLGNLMPDEYDVTVAYTGDECFYNKTAKATLNITKADPNITVESKQIPYTGNTILPLTYNSLATGKVNITLKGKKYNLTFTDIDLNTQITLGNLMPDEYDVTVAYTGDECFYNKTAKATLNITKANPNLTVESKQVPYTGNTNITLSYNSLATGKVNITLKVPKYTLTLNNLDLNTTISLGNVLPDKYDIIVAYSGDECFLNTTATATLKVNKIATQITSPAVTATYNSAKYLTITLKDSTGKAVSGAKVTVNLNGIKTYATDKNGQIKINVATMVPKTYSAKITFAGDDIYTESAAAAKVIVKKAKAKIVAKKKTFKKAKKVKKYTITLKSGKKPIKKVKVTLKIKKKTYKAKTNARGKATFKIKKLTKKGTYKATIKFKGNKYYNKATKKVKIKIK